MFCPYQYMLSMPCAPPAIASMDIKHRSPISMSGIRKQRRWQGRNRKKKKSTKILIQPRQCNQEDKLTSPVLTCLMNFITFVREHWNSNRRVRTFHRVAGIRLRARDGGTAKPKCFLKRKGCRCVIDRKIKVNSILHIFGLTARIHFAWQ